jgi:hypothetical protein
MAVAISPVPRFPRTGTVKPAQAPSERALRFVRVLLVATPARHDVEDSK